MLGTFPKDVSQEATSYGYLPLWQHPKCAISQATTSKFSSSRSTPPPPHHVLAAALCPLAQASRSARPPLGSCRLGNCEFGKLSLVRIPLGSCHLGKILGKVAKDNLYILSPPPSLRSFEHPPLLYTLQSPVLSKPPTTPSWISRASPKSTIFKKRVKSSY